MHPQTPKNPEKKSVGLTPSFTFGSLGPLPSAFRFVLPRNMNLLSSLSPHRLFNKFCKGVSESEDKNGEILEETAHILPETGLPTRRHSRARTDIGLCESFHDSMSNFNDQLSSQNFHNASTVELFGTSDEMDIWSFAGDSHAVSMNLTAITEVADDKDAFFSPHEIFLEQSPLESDVSASQTLHNHGESLGGKNGAKIIKKRRLSSMQSSPSTKAAIKASILESPQRVMAPFSQEELKDLKKVWTQSLDEELLRCLNKYNTLKSSHGAKEELFKGTSQNRILSRMLEKKTGVYRTQKQISGRLLKLMKPGPPKVTVELAAESTPMSHNQQVAFRSTPSWSPRRSRPLIPIFESFNMMFTYKDSKQRSHTFTTICQRPTLSTEHKLSIKFAKKTLPQKNAQFLTDFDAIAPELKAQNVNIHNIHSNLNLDPNFYDLSSPVSPMTSPRQFSTENGKFLTYANVILRGDLFDQSFVTLQSKTMVYKNANKMLFETEESINGYREGKNDFRLEIPFLNHFWAGFLTYIVNGTSDFSDVENIVILQMIFDDSGPSRKIYGYFVYRFSPSTTGLEGTKVDMIKLINENESEGDVDEQETILASSPSRSSPFKPSPTKMNLRIQTDLPHGIVPGPSTAPVFSSGLVHQNNVNYEFAKTSGGYHQRPLMPVSKSTTNFNFEKRPASAVMLHANHSFNHGVRHHSAGQMGSFNPTSTPVLAPGILGDSCFYDHQPNHTVGGQPQFIGNPSGMIHSQQMAMNNVNQVPGNVHQNQQHHSQVFPNGSVVVPPQMGHGHPTNGGHRPWPISTNYHNPQEINSAPASQLQFFPSGGKAGRDNGRKSRELGPPLKFQTMLLYDPSKGMNQETKSQNKDASFHTFAVKPQIVFQKENT